MRNYDVILFDLDGTLTDSAPGILNSVRYACRKLGLEMPSEATLRKFLGPPPESGQIPPGHSPGASEPSR